MLVALGSCTRCCSCSVWSSELVIPGETDEASACGSLIKLCSEGRWRRGVDRALGGGEFSGLGGCVREAASKAPLVERECAAGTRSATSCTSDELDVDRGGRVAATLVANDATGETNVETRGDASGDADADASGDSSGVASGDSSGEASGEAYAESRGESAEDAQADGKALRAASRFRRCLSMAS